MGTRAHLFLGGVLALILGLGCSASGPTVRPATAPPEAALVPTGTGVFGVYTLELDPISASATLAPVREATAFGDSWWLNATGFLDGAPCKDCLSVDSVRKDIDGNVVLGLRARHPFPAGDPDLPVSGSNRLDLHVFDAQLLFAGELDALTVSLPGGGVTVPRRLVRDAAGYSAILTSVAQAIDPGLTGTAFPYVTLNEDRTVGNFLNSNPAGFADVEAPTGFNVFPMGADVTREVTLGVTAADGPIRLTVMFSCSYGQSAVGRSQRLNPVYALPEYNAKAPWRVEVEIPAGTNNLAAGDTGSSAEVQVRVWDWQAGVTIDPNLNDIATIRSASDPGTLTLNVPGVLNNPITFGAASSGTGPFDDPLIYNTLLLNQAGAPLGSYTGLVEVQDSRAPGGNSGGQGDVLSSINGSSIDPVALTAFRTYQILEVPIGGVTRQLESIDISPTMRQIIAQGAGEAVTFTAVGNYNMAPLTEDLTATAVWDSSLLDVATFTSNLLTGIGMGTTAVTATSGAVTSAATIVIVKPVEFISRGITGNLGWELDADDNNGEVYATLAGARGVEVYDTAGVLQRSWSCSSADLPQSPGGIAVDEANGIVYVADAGPASPAFAVVYDLNGNKLNRYALAGYSDGTGICVMGNGTLWHVNYVPSPLDITQVDPTDGSQIGGFSGSGLAQPIGCATKDNLLYVANVGGRWSDTGIIIYDPPTNTVLAKYSQMPAAGGQNDRIAVDRDGYMHVLWHGPPQTIQAYEYIPPSTINLLYTYQFSASGPFIGTGITVSRPENVVVATAFAPGIQAWFQ